MHTLVRRFLVITTLIATLTVSACGYIMYPERRGQTGGQIDPGIVLLDGIGLIFFLIPGVVAFAVDFTSGTIYLPPGQSHSDILSKLDVEKAKIVETHDKHLTPQDIREAIHRATGIDLKNNYAVNWRIRSNQNEQWHSIKQALTEQQLAQWKQPHTNKPKLAYIAK